MSKIVEIGTRKHTVVSVLDEPGQGNACHEYAIHDAKGHILGRVSFQNGPIGDVGVNGVHNEDLLAIVAHRLQGFQSGPYSCRENSLALTKIQEGLHWLRHRTDARESRGVEGTHEV
jgi:hypothetical protein